MTPAERAQVGASLALAQAMQQQAVAMLHEAEAQIASLTAALGAEPPSAETQAVRDLIYAKTEEAPRSRHYGSRPNVSGAPDTNPVTVES